MAINRVHFTLVLFCVRVYAFEEGKELQLLPFCGHMFHIKRILSWLAEKKTVRPLCQKTVKISNDADDGADSENKNSDRNGLENASLPRLEEDYT